MPMQWRPMKPNDVAGCADIIAAHPVIGPRYGSTVKDLRHSWLRLLGSAAMTTAVFEEVEKGRVTLAGVGVGVLLSWLAGQVLQWPVPILPRAIGLALGAAMLVGIVSGLYPAKRASQLNVSDALRFE